MLSDVTVLHRQLEDLQAANARLQGERDQFRNAYTQLRLEQAPTQHERHQIQSKLEQREEMTRIYEENVDLTEHGMTIDFPIPNSTLVSRVAKRPSSTPVVKIEPPSPCSSASRSLLPAFARQDTLPPTIIPPRVHDVKLVIRKRKLVPYVEISTRPPPGYVRDVSNGDILGPRPHQRPRRKAAAKHQYVKLETPPPDLNARNIKPEPSVDEDRKPKKKDEQSIIIPPDFIESLLRGVPALAVPNLLCKVRRNFLTSTYGCASQGFYGYIAPIRIRPALPDAIQPGSALGPGRPGLVFSVQRKMLEHTASLFVKETAAVAVWKYYGEYRSVICGTMEKKLWMMQTIELRTSWAAKILRQNMPCYRSMHARIKLRKAGRAVTDDAVFDLMQKKSNHGLSVPDVLHALDKGEEALDIIRMECVSYDEPFLHHVYARSRGWDPDDPFSGALTDSESSSEEGRMSDVET
ncbi:hypothetical protein BDZ89DRAFT_1079926 [Hymenopellis radicata]|nr:hypothetical protein BDZ89DRAFT_1079926 [Hymenopellis radicata]